MTSRLPLVLIAGLMNQIPSGDTIPGANVSVASTSAYGVVKVGTEVREKLTGSRNYYIRTDGSDSNDGLTNSSGGAFLTVQAAINALAKLDIGTNQVNLRCQTGTYTGNISYVGGWLGTGVVFLRGDGAVPSDVVLSLSGYGAFNVQKDLSIGGLQITAGSGGQGILVGGGATLTIVSDMEFNTCARAHIECLGGAVGISSNYHIIGNAPTHIWLTQLSRYVLSGRTITLTGTPAFSDAFVVAESGSAALLGSLTLSGSATGKRYRGTTNASIDTQGGGDTYLPGDAVGTLATGAQYKDSPSYQVSRNTAQFDKTNNSTLGTVTGLTALNLIAGGTYKIRASLFVTGQSVPGGGIKVALGGTATATSFAASGFCPNDTSSTMVSGGTTTFGGAVIDDNGGPGTSIRLLLIEATIVVNAAGTLIVQFAQHTAASGFTTSVLVNSTLEAWRMT